MITEQHSIQIAQEYLLRKTGRKLRLMDVSYKEGASTSYITEPTWAVWFWLDIEGVSGHVEMYVDATTGEPWQIDYGTPDDASTEASE